LADSSVTSTSGLRTYADYQKSLRQTGQELGKNDFLKLLAAQLQYQNPLEPMSDSDFVAQLAQFSSLEQMENLNSTLSTQSYYSFAGKYVSAEITLPDGRTGSIIGVVDSVFTDKGTSYCELGNCLFIDADGNSSQLEGAYVIEASKINQVYDSKLFESPVVGGDSSGQQDSLLSASALIGRLVSALTTGEDGETKTISGVVTGVSKGDDGRLAARLEDGETGEIYDIDIGSITEIHQ
jgi:flagellar basal-body rod modification protein FlgD